MKQRKRPRDRRKRNKRSIKVHRKEEHEKNNECTSPTQPKPQPRSRPQLQTTRCTTSRSAETQKSRKIRHYPFSCKRQRILIEQRIYFLNFAESTPIFRLISNHNPLASSTASKYAGRYPWSICRRARSETKSEFHEIEGFDSDSDIQANHNPLPESSPHHRIHAGRKKGNHC